MPPYTHHCLEEALRLRFGVGLVGVRSALKTCPYLQTYIWGSHFLRFQKKWINREVLRLQLVANTVDVFDKFIAAGRNLVSESLQRRVYG